MEDQTIQFTATNEVWNPFHLFKYFNIHALTPYLALLALNMMIMISNPRYSKIIS